jgi:hypothetical protein
VEVDLEEEVDRPLSRDAGGKPCRTVASSYACSGNVEEGFNGGPGDSSLPVKPDRRGFEKSSYGRASFVCRLSVGNVGEVLLLTRSLDVSVGFWRKFWIYVAELELVR